MPAQHDTAGKTIALQVVSLDASGNPSSAGKIGVICIGMRNWTDELCLALRTEGPCSLGTFLAQATANSQVNQTTLVLVDCAQSGHSAADWIDDSDLSYSTCIPERLYPFIRRPGAIPAPGLLHPRRLICEKYSSKCAIIFPPRRPGKRCNAKFFQSIGQTSAANGIRIAEE